MPWVTFNPGLRLTGFRTTRPSSLGQQVDSRSGQVIFHSHLPYGQEIRQVICQLNYQKSKLRLGASKILELLVLRVPQAGIRGFFFRALRGVSLLTLVYLHVVVSELGVTANYPAIIFHDHFIYMCRFALKNEVYNNSCYSYLVRCK